MIALVCDVDMDEMAAGVRLTELSRLNLTSMAIATGEDVCSLCLLWTTSTK